MTHDRSVTHADVFHAIASPHELFELSPRREVFVMAIFMTDHDCSRTATSSGK